MKRLNQYQCLLIIVTGIVCGTRTNAGTSAILWKTLTALGRGLQFFETEYEKLNLDAIIGTRLVDGQLKVLLEHLTGPDAPKLPPRLVKKIQDLQATADRISDATIPIIRATQPNYYRRIGAILQPDFWSLDYASRDVDRSLILPLHDATEAMVEDDSDDCLTELFGTGSGSTKTCQVTPRCWRLMTRQGYSGYSLSHEVFFLEIGEAFGCFRGKMMEKLDELNSGFCANMYAEARDIFIKGFPETRQDLFMEIPALCGMLGYRQFFREDWLEAMLSWQWERGCWGSKKPPIPKGSRGRFKREEKQLPDGCECHRTAVAIGALAQYVRFIVEYMQTTGDGVMR